MSLAIHGWDYTPSSCKTPYGPAFYFLPDYDWISYININGPLHVPVIITGTGLYDGEHWVKLDKQPETFWHIGFLKGDFIGYPRMMGQVKLNAHSNLPMVPVCLKCQINGCC